MTAGKHDKNSPISVVHSSTKTRSCLTHGHTEVRQLRNASGRLYELQRCVDATGWTVHAKHLHRKVDRLFPQQNRSLKLWRTKLSMREQLLVSARKEQALKSWKERIKHDKSDQFKWIAKTSSPITMNLFHSNLYNQLEDRQRNSNFVTQRIC